MFEKFGFATTIFTHDEQDFCTFFHDFMLSIEKDIEKAVSSYRNNFNYVRRTLDKLSESKRRIAEKHLKKYFDSCKRIDMCPEPENCLAIVNEINDIGLS